MKKLLIIIVLLMAMSSAQETASALTIPLLAAQGQVLMEQCQNSFVSALKGMMGKQGPGEKKSPSTAINGAPSTAINGAPSTASSGAPSTGYFRDLDALTSTGMPTSSLISQVERLARDARLELDTFCREIGKLREMESDYALVYDLQACRELKVEEADIRLNMYSLCQKKADEELNIFLNAIPQTLVLDAVSTSMQPMFDKLRGLNARMTGLLTEYGRMIKNIFTFNFRLGETITGKK